MQVEFLYSEHACRVHGDHWSLFWGLSWGRKHWGICPHCCEEFGKIHSGDFVELWSPSRACTAHLARNMSARNVSNFQVDLIWNNPEIKQWICVFQILGFLGSWFVVDISARINECVFTNGMSEKVFTCSSVATVLMCKSAEILPLQGFLCGLTIPYEALLLGPRFLRSSNLQRAYRVILECVPKLCGKKGAKTDVALRFKSGLVSGSTSWES